MDSKEADSLAPAINAIRHLLANSIWLESMQPTYHFMIDADDWTWTPDAGIRRGKPEAPTCVVQISEKTLGEILQGRRDPKQLQQQGLIKLGGLLSDAVALSKAFLTEEQQLLRWRRLFNEVDFSLKNWSTEGRRLQVESLQPVMNRIEKENPGQLGRVRKVLESWVNHTISTCRLNQWVRFDFEGLEVQPWENSSALDLIVQRSFSEMRKEAMSFLDGRVRAPHYGGSDADPDRPAAGRPPGWRSYNLIEYFKWQSDRASKFPVVSSVLKEISRDHTIVHGGFLILEPGVSLPPHADGANWLLSYQFGLVVPNDCYLQVDDEKRFHREGYGMVFNDSFVHSAANEGDRTRILFAVLYANPQLSEPEREAMAEISLRLPEGAIAYAN